jgi:hypothetical protein
MLAALPANPTWGLLVAVVMSVSQFPLRRSCGDAEKTSIDERFDVLTGGTMLHAVQALVSKG